MNKLIETHAHIYAEQFQDDIDEVLERAWEGGLDSIYMPNIDHTSIDGMLELESKHSNCHAMMGLHPCSVNKDFEKELYIVEEWLNKRTWVAIGEIGTDLFWDKSYWNQQQEAFKIQCQWAINYNRPVVIHCRETIDETIDMVENFANEKLRGVFHCFTGNEKQAKRITDLGFYIGIGGVATFKNGGLNSVIPKIAEDKIVLETDSPYLAPMPNRGKRNEPAYINLVAAKVAEYKNVSVEEITSLTSLNALSLFQ